MAGDILFHHLSVVLEEYLSKIASLFQKNTSHWMGRGHCWKCKQNSFLLSYVNMLLLINMHCCICCYETVVIFLLELSIRLLECSIVLLPLPRRLCFCIGLFVWLVGWFVPWQNYSKKSYRWIFVKRLARNSQQQLCSNAWHLHIAIGNTAIRNPTVRKPLISACISRKVIRPRKTALWGKPSQLMYFDMWWALTEVYILWVHSTSYGRPM